MVVPCIEKIALKSTFFSNLLESEDNILAAFERLFGKPVVGIGRED